MWIIFTRFSTRMCKSGIFTGYTHINLPFLWITSIKTVFLKNNRDKKIVWISAFLKEKIDCDYQKKRKNSDLSTNECLFYKNRQKISTVIHREKCVYLA